MMNNTTGHSCHYARMSCLRTCSLVACVFLFTSTSIAEDVPRRNQPTERITLPLKESLWFFEAHGEIAGDLWATADVKPPPPAQSVPLHSAY